MKFLDKMKAAGNVVADLETYAEQRADKLIARGAQLRAKTDTAFNKHEDRAAQNYAALDSFEHAIDTIDALGNGGSSDGEHEAGDTMPGTPYDGTNGAKPQ